VRATEIEGKLKMSREERERGDVGEASRPVARNTLEGFYERRADEKERNEDLGKGVMARRKRKRPTQNFSKDQNYRTNP